VESVAVVIAVGDPADVPGSAGLPELAVTGLPDEEARALLTSALVWPVDEQVPGRIVAETRGNPLALVELSRGLAKGELAGGFGPVSTATLPSRIEGMAARSRALMTEGLTAEGVYCEAIDRLACAGVRSELARAHLCLAQRRGDAAPCAAGRAGHHRDPITKCLTIRRPRHGTGGPEGQNHGEPQRAP
jgi:hypothetical protein